MSKHGTIRRYTLIIEKIGRNQYPSFEVIKEYLFEHGFEVSARTIQRDIEQIRFEFGVEILYDRSKNGYFINSEDSVNTDSFIRFLEIVNTAELLSESLKESKEALSYLSFESTGNLKGIENLKPLLFAIKNKRWVSITYKKFDSDTPFTFLVQPYLLKEFQNRWYLIGIIKGTDVFKTFGIDRIHDLTISDETFTGLSHEKAKAQFEHTIGLSYSNQQPVEVILSFTPHQANYIKTLPLHKSQEVILETNDEVHVRLYVIPNFEFKQQLLMLGDSVKVLQPTWLVQEVKQALASALNKYRE